jgi:hypothetical protein
VTQLPAEGRIVLLRHVRLWVSDNLWFILGVLGVVALVVVAMTLGTSGGPWDSSTPSQGSGQPASGSASSSGSTSTPESGTLATTATTGPPTTQAASPPTTTTTTAALGTTTTTLPTTTTTTGSANAYCFPLSGGGSCYEPGDPCSDLESGASGLAGDGERIVCENNGGWLWEPIG